jgi:hypothetical protein
MKNNLGLLIAQNLADIDDTIENGLPKDIRNLVEAQTKIAYEAGVKKGVEEEKERIIKIIEGSRFSSFYPMVIDRRPTCDNESCSAIGAYNQALSDLLSELNKQEK